MNKTLSTLTILVFALLQCIAPLVHAHVDGQQTGTSSLVQGFSLTSSASSLDHCFAEQGESQAISLPQEYQRDDTPVISNALLAVIRTIPWSSHNPSFALPAPASSNTVLFIIPPAQAPPIPNT